MARTLRALVLLAIGAVVVRAGLVTALGITTERIHCSSGPDQLTAVSYGSAVRVFEPACGVTDAFDTLVPRAEVSFRPAHARFPGLRDHHAPASGEPDDRELISPHEKLPRMRLRATYVN